MSVSERSWLSVLDDSIVPSHPSRETCRACGASRISSSVRPHSAGPPGLVAGWRGQGVMKLPADDPLVPRLTTFYRVVSEFSRYSKSGPGAWLLGCLCFDVRGRLGIQRRSGEKSFGGRESRSGVEVGSPEFCPQLSGASEKVIGLEWRSSYLFFHKSSHTVTIRIKPVTLEALGGHSVGLPIAKARHTHTHTRN